MRVQDLLLQASLSKIVMNLRKIVMNLRTSCVYQGTRDAFLKTLRAY